jgi:hypothetical protein
MEEIGGGVLVLKLKNKQIMVCLLMEVRKQKFRRKQGYQM